MNVISEHAIVESGASLASDVQVGPFSVIGKHVTIGAGTRVGSHVVIEGHVDIGDDNIIYHHALLGAPPQDLKYKGEPTRLEIGNGNIIREFTTLHRGTPGGGGVTKIGNKCLIMAYAHVAHDCRLGNDVILANAVNMAGHVRIDDYAIVGGLSAIHQFVRIGRYAFIGGMTAVAQDILPFSLVAGERGKLRGINAVGLKRRGFSTDARRKLHTAVRYLLSSDMSISGAVEKIGQEFGDDPDIKEMLAFIAQSERGICLR